MSLPENTRGSFPIDPLRDSFIPEQRDETVADEVLEVPRKPWRPHVEFPTTTRSVGERAIYGFDTDTMGLPSVAVPENETLPEDS